MNVTQMLAHVTANLEMATSDKEVHQMLMGRLFGKGAKQQILTSGVQPKNMVHLRISRFLTKESFKKKKKFCGVDSSVFIKVAKQQLRGSHTASLVA
jgi:hypothetical protein